MKEFVPTPYQQQVLLVPENYNLLLAGGRGGGKSTAANLCVLRHVEKYKAQARPLIVRESYKAAQQIWESLVDLLSAAYPRGLKPNLTDHVIRVPNGAQIEIGQVDSATANRKFQGRETTLLVPDEYGLVRDRRWVGLLKANLRAPSGIPLREIRTANPGGHQHAYLHSTHIQGRAPWAPYEVDGETWVNCPSTMRDNPHLDHEDYKRRLLAACGRDKDLYRAWDEGDWNINRGAFFAELSEQHHLLNDSDLPLDQIAAIRPGAVPTGVRWLRGTYSFVAGDWGLSAPSVVLFVVRLTQPYKWIPAGSLLVIDEIATADPDDVEVGLGWPPSKLADAVVERCRKWGIYPQGSFDDAHGLDESLLQVFQRCGLYVTLPDKQRVSGWASIKELLANARERNNKPYLLISPRAEYLWRTLPNLQRDPLRPEDLSSTGPDHGADALRYAVTTPDRRVRIHPNPRSR
ncbi:MAG: hypothetical protein K2P86_02680 [Xanthobacteraceae bacterium]|nr:hypothetical protein [Xanthobacteraceae bacterium]